MSDFSLISKDQLYLDYFRKSTNAFIEKVRFFEIHRSALNKLEDYQFQEIKIVFDTLLWLYSESYHRQQIKKELKSIHNLYKTIQS